MKKITIIFLLVFIGFKVKAQNYVTIPDANFVTFLQNKYPACMSGNQMDTTCASILNDTSLIVDNKNISNLTGVEYFKNLRHLICYSNQLTSLPSLPNTLLTLNCFNNSLASLPALPGSLKEIFCGENSLVNLPALPNSLERLHCVYNQLTDLPVLPNSLLELICAFNQLSALPLLPATLNDVDCTNNTLVSLPTLPNSLRNLYCGDNLLTSLPQLPNSLQVLSCYLNQLTSLPTLQNSLSQLNCSSNQLSILPSLPATLQYLSCGANQLTNLPPLPNLLKRLSCYNNQLSSLPDLPDTLQWLDCANNSISCFPEFPSSLSSGDPSNLYWFSIEGNPFSCLPNYVAGMDAGTLSYPLCVNGDSINNPNNCNSSNGIVGYIYKDSNINCTKNTGDQGLLNIPLKLYDNGNNLLAQTYSFSNGLYNFPDSIGTYTVKIDTIGAPFTIQCTFPGIDSTVTLTTANPLATDVNFGIICKPGFDVGVQSVFASGRIFPGQQHKLSVVAGDISKWYNFYCASGISGQVQVTVTGPVTYNGTVSGALVPSVSGNVFTYTIADFETTDIQKDFGLMFTTDTTATVGDRICVTVNVSPVTGDNDASNNTYTFCYHVSNSYDPNFKDVYPVDVLPGYEDWFTYTIHFQNTGNDSALNIRLLDTLSNDLDLNTFRVINYSHYNRVVLNGNELTFRFPNIMLPDSTSDSEGSKGFVQYRIKPKANLPLGTKVQNTAHIYFDYNIPVTTNTTVNEYVQTISIHENEITAEVNVYPNPSKGNIQLEYTIKQNNTGMLKIYALTGKLLEEYELSSNKNELQLNTNLSNGIYLYRVIVNDRIVKSDKLVVIK
ncbi:MAG: DUF7619 domain-containing protein [Bacteroidota bacterium]